MKFSVGEWVFYYNPGHEWDMMLMQVAEVRPSVYSHLMGEYLLVYGPRNVTAREDQVLHRRDSAVPGHITTPSPFFSNGNGIIKVPPGSVVRMVGGGGGGSGRTFNPRIENIEVSAGERLDEIAKEYGLPRRRDWQFGSEQAPESDSSYRAFLKNCLLGKASEDPHSGHEVVENHALGKKFLYCRKCKTEVFRD